jgi:hypothetical protein
VNLASYLIAHLQLLGLEIEQELAAAEPENPRAMLLNILGRPTSHARTGVLEIRHSWSWAKAVVEAWHRLGAIPAPA